ncbi:hypothetical protein OPV22_030576 [Ensete ventricosum]|uniref:Uncharacterized protein n=1 Tax=Ensete ventricosum TaxID=4639 RepID=A0AAV8QGI6_ENSVE|nr:hypothetical protein OPV22_030576 [Ensete ventricosum]
MFPFTVYGSLVRGNTDPIRLPTIFSLVFGVTVIPWDPFVSVEPSPFNIRFLFALCSPRLAPGLIATWLAQSCRPWFLDQWIGGPDVLRTLLMPSVNAIFFNGDKVQGTGNSVIERLSDSRNISELLVSKLGCSANVWVVEASTFNGPFAVYKEFIPSLTTRGDPKRYDPNGFPASSAIVAILSRCFEQVPSLTSSNLVEQTKGNVDAPTLLPTPSPKTIILGFSKGGTVVNQLVTELAHLKASPQIFDRSAGAYLTDRTVIKKVAELLLVHNASIRFVLHGTPRQWFDHHRPWIRKEKDIMLQLLKDEAHRCEGRLQATEKIYFANSLPSLQMHFEIIQVMDLS